MKYYRGIIVIVLATAIVIILYNKSDIILPRDKHVMLPTSTSRFTATVNHSIRTTKVIHRMNSRYGQSRKGWIDCGESRCYVIHGASSVAGADLALFSELDVNFYRKPPIKDRQQLWGFYSNEPQFKISHKMEQLSKWNGLFNYSATFLRDTEGSKFIFRPGVVKRSPPTKQYFTPQPKMRKLRALWFVSHCKHHYIIAGIQSARVEYVLELSKYMDIDIYTRDSQHNGCRNILGQLIKNKKGDSEPNMGDYMFYLAFENGLCTDYISEKFWKVLESNSTTIPVALGGSSVVDYEAIAPPNSFIHVRNFTSPEALANHLKFVAQDSEAFHYYNQWRNEFDLDTSRHVMYKNDKHLYYGNFLCYFCNLVNEGRQSIWNTFSEDYGVHQCVDVTEPKAYCPYYNLSCVLQQ